MHLLPLEKGIPVAPTETFDPLATLQTRLWTGGRLTCAPEWAGAGQLVHTNPFARLYFVRAGGGAVIHSRRIFRLRPGRHFVIPANTPGRYRSDGDLDLSWIHFTAQVLGVLDPFQLLGWELSPRLPRPEWTERLWDRLLELLNDASAAGRLEADGLVRQLLAGCALPRRQAEPQLASLARLQSVFTLIESRLDERLTLTELAQAARLEKSYFCTFFTRVVGLPPLRFALQQRIRRAESLLVSSATHLDQIAAATGFHDAFHFSRTFKKVTGLSPSQYRNQPLLEG